MNDKTLNPLVQTNTSIGFNNSSIPNWFAVGNLGVSTVGSIFGIANAIKQWDLMKKQYNLAKEQWDYTKDELERIKQVRNAWNKKYFS
jgi:hypothetical protein